MPHKLQAMAVFRPNLSCWVKQLKQKNVSQGKYDRQHLECVNMCIKSVIISWNLSRHKCRDAYSIIDLLETLRFQEIKAADMDLQLYWFRHTFWSSKFDFWTWKKTLTKMNLNIEESDVSHLKHKVSLELNIIYLLYCLFYKFKHFTMLQNS